MTALNKQGFSPQAKCIVGIILMMLLAACGPAEQTFVTSSTPSSSTPSSEGYPAPQPTVIQSEAYPPPAETSGGTLLAIDKPLKANDTVITGVGPAGLSILIMNITFMGEEIGAGIIAEDGTFSIEVAPLLSAVRVGVTADVAAQGVAISSIQPGEGAINVPQVGYYFDSAVVVED